MGRRQPVVKGKQGGLQHQSEQHQAAGNAHGRRRVDIDQQRQRLDRHRAIRAVDQRDAQQIHARADQRGEEITQAGRDLGGRAAHGHQPHGGQADEFQRDIEVEQVGGEKQRIQSRQQEAGQRPEIPHRGGIAGEVAACEKQQRQRDSLRQQQHHGRQAIRREIDAQRCPPAADGVFDRRPASADFCGECESQPQLNGHAGDGQPRPASRFEQEGARGPEQRQQDQPGQRISHPASRAGCSRR